MKNEALHTLFTFAGWTENRLRGLELTGGTDPIVQTPFKISETATAALAAVGLAASDLWRLRTGRDQDVSVDARHATASLRSSRYMKFDGGDDLPEHSPLMGVYAAKNGRWSYLHCNFPHHRANALKVLGVPEDREQVRKAVAQWDAFELEDALINAGGVGGMVRPFEEWASHPQGTAIASLPLMEIMKSGDTPPEPLPPGDRPLSGIRVLDLTRVVAGPSGGRTLAEHGADVLKITAPHLPIVERQEYDTGHGKLSAHLDLREEKNREILQGLIREADVFSQGYRPGALSSRGFSPQALAQLRPGIVAVSLSAFGHVGPWSARRGFDTVVQTVSGISTRQAEVFPGVESGPQFYPASAVDFITGYLMAFGTMVALRRRAEEGGSWFVRISLAQVGRWLIQQGEVPVSKLKNVRKDFMPEEIEGWSTISHTPIGQLRHLKPVVCMSETPTRWTRPVVPLGYHEPIWPKR